MGAVEQARDREAERVERRHGLAKRGGPVIQRVERQLGLDRDHVVQALARPEQDLLVPALGRQLEEDAGTLQADDEIGEEIVEATHLDDLPSFDGASWKAGLYRLGRL